MLGGWLRCDAGLLRQARRLDRMFSCLHAIRETFVQQCVCTALHAVQVWRGAAGPAAGQGLARAARAAHDRHTHPPYPGARLHGCEVLQWKRGDVVSMQRGLMLTCLFHSS